MLPVSTAWYINALLGRAISPASLWNVGCETPESLELIHPDDRHAATQAAARAFWTGVPQVMKYRRRQPDGSYSWVDIRTTPEYGVSVDINDLMTDKEQPMTMASDSFNESGSEAVRVAKVIER
ncbi:PAS domain-containing protein [Phyllobacterium sp. SB3]|uniref:PAS domain-containing protein n=1 Tax=Phyllobacterium sp. SB3 TaxID=3156073 RepID=UPI0032B02203